MKPRATHRVLHTRVLHTRHSAVYIGRANKPGRAEGICRLHTVDALTLSVWTVHVTLRTVHGAQGAPSVRLTVQLYS